VQFVGPTAVQNDIGLSFSQTGLAAWLRLRVVIPVMRVCDAIDACMLACRQCASLCYQPSLNFYSGHWYVIYV